MGYITFSSANGYVKNILGRGDRAGIIGIVGAVGVVGCIEVEGGLATRQLIGFEVEVTAPAVCFFI